MPAFQAHQNTPALGRYRPLALAFALLIGILSGATAAVRADIIDPTGKKLIRIASETNSQMFVTTLNGAASWAAAATNLPDKFADWQNAGFEGMSITIASNDPSKGFTNMGAQWWNVQAQRDYSEFTDEIATLTAQNWGRLTDNFLHSSMAPWDNPSRVDSQDWFNDDHWATILHNVGVQARVAKELGFKGVLLDTEQYDHHGSEPWYHPFDYGAYATGGYRLGGYSQPFSFEESKTKLLQRGAQYAHALSTEFPGITLWLIPAIHRPPIGSLLVQENLYQSFIDGILLGLDDNAKLIAGSEATYNLSKLTSFTTIRDGTLQQYLNRSNFDQILQDKWSFATGVFADAPPGWSDTDATENLRKPQEHEDAVRNALAVSDEYAWLYGERSRFLDTTPTPLMGLYLQANEDARQPDVAPVPAAFSDTFDLSGGGSNPIGGQSVLLGNGHFYDDAREGVYFSYLLQHSEQEYHAEPDEPPAATDEYTAEVVWTVDAGSTIRHENATLLNGTGFEGGEQRALIRIEAKSDPNHNSNRYVLEVSADGEENYIGVIPNLTLTKGNQITIRAHNLGDGTLDLYVNNTFIANYIAGAGQLDWLGNLGNNTPGMGFSSALLHSVSVTFPTLALLMGDANNDGLVSGLDLIAVQQNFGNTGTADGVLLGDANDDGQVSGQDLIAVQQNFGTTLTLPGAPAPEPATSILLGTCLLLVCRRS